jgi:(Z)-2-((N-methylformamido)methylene)-5-hydroxybutyrolactone dehydrogenase
VSTPPEMETFDLFIDNQSIPPAADGYFETENPYTGAAWARVANATAADVDRAVRAAHRAMSAAGWRKAPVERAALLRRLGDLVKANVEKLAAAEVRDNGKTIGEMRTQMRNTAEWYYYYGGLADKIEGRVLPTENPELFNFTLLEPLGVVAAILPWNSPLRLLAWKVAPALAAGNAIVVKPSEFTSTSTLIFAELVREAGFPPGIFNVLTGAGAEAGALLMAHPLVAKIAFTGGEVAGRKVYEAAARDFKHASLELGGKAANIVFEDADFDNAVNGAVTGIFTSAGQSCTAGSRILVQRSIRDKFVEAIAALGRKGRMGDPMNPATEIGPIATRPQYERILKAIEGAKAEGARLHSGGKPARVDGNGGLFIEPTIFVDVDNSMRLAQDEIFGPVAAVIPFDTEDEAISIANDTRYGLTGGVWTQDIARAHRVVAAVDAGTIWVNIYRVTSQLSPYGGFKHSGIGKEGGSQIIYDYLREKSVWFNLAPGVKSPFAG